VVALHGRQEGVGETDLPGTLGVRAGIQERVGLVDDQHRAVLLRLPEGVPDVALGHPNVRVDQLGRLLAVQLPPQPAGQVTGQLALARARRAVEEQVEVPHRPAGAPASQLKVEGF